MPNPDPEKPMEQPRWSRYDRVKDILNRAAGAANPSYQGYGRFWNLPHAEFLRVYLYGVRMIAPPAGCATGSSLLPIAPAKSCCHTPAATPAPPAAAPLTRQSGRGAASGLIVALKGLPPFDNSQFPPLPWGGTRVSPADIS